MYIICESVSCFFEQNGLLIQTLFSPQRKIFDEDNYTPMLCQDETEYNDILKEFPFDETEVLQVLMRLS